MKKNIAIIAGGDSSEFVVSVKSAAMALEKIDPVKFNGYIITMKNGTWKAKDKYDVDKNDFSFIENGQKIITNCAFIMIHGTPGEDGKLQGYFDMIGIPYTTCGVLSSALTFNKLFTKEFLKNYHITSAKYVFIKKGDKYDENSIARELGLPCFVKPNNAGSSFGITKVKNVNELSKAIEHAFSEDDSVLIEEYLEGIELTCGLLKTSKKNYIWPITEIVSKNEFFDYEAKYTTGMADEITPARVTDKLTRECQELSSRIYDILDCRGIVRVDFIYTRDRFYLLEVNTVPGMSPNSIVPQQIRAGGYTETEIFTALLEDAMIKTA